MSLGLCVFGLASDIGAGWANPVFQSYETGFGEWRPQAFLATPDPTWEWSVTRANGQASHGEWALMLTASGVHDDGTVWVERSLELPAGEWEVRLDFDLWSPFDADVGTWEKVACIDVVDPEAESHFTVLGLEDFGGWHTYSLVKSFSLETPRVLWFAFGLNIVFETTHTHYCDAATIRWTPSQPIESRTWGILKALFR